MKKVTQLIHTHSFRYDRRVAPAIYDMAPSSEKHSNQRWQDTHWVSEGRKYTS